MKITQLQCDINKKKYYFIDIVSGGQSTQIKYLSKSTDTYTKILLQYK